ncbi:protein translocase subunit SecF [bacterium]|nr:protein translocase subunit SecF [bacterium]
MQIFKNTKYNFLSLQKPAFIISAVIIGIGLISLLLHKGPNLGIDFKGGTIIQVQFEKDIDISSIRNSLSTVNLGNSEIKRFGTSREILIKTDPVKSGERHIAEIIKEVLHRDFTDNPYDIRRIEEVGPKMGSELVKGALLSIIFACLLMGIYVSWRFEFKFAVGAVAALTHDVLVTIGIFSLLNIEFDLKVVASILLIVGYSLNDTIVVYDRIRENMKILRKETHESLINKSINAVLSRTVVTSLTTLLVIVIIFLFGGEVLHNFAFALLIGIITGTYSSIYIASPIVSIWKDRTDIRIRKK